MSDKDIVKNVRELLKTHSIEALSDDREPGTNINTLIAALCDEAERLRRQLVPLRKFKKQRTSHAKD